MTNDPDTLPFLALRTAAWPDKGGFNSGYYSNPKVDALLEKARESTDQAERAKLYKQMQEIVYDDAPWAFVANWKQNAGDGGQCGGLLAPAVLLPVAARRLEELDVRTDGVRRPAAPLAGDLPLPRDTPQWRAYILKRLLAMIPVLIGLSVIVFLIMALIPGDPATAILGAFATPENVARINRELGLDKPCSSNT